MAPKISHFLGGALIHPDICFQDTQMLLDND